MNYKSWMCLGIGLCLVVLVASAYLFLEVYHFGIYLATLILCSGFLIIVFLTYKGLKAPTKPTPKELFNALSRAEK